MRRGVWLMGVALLRGLLRAVSVIKIEYPAVEPSSRRAVEPSSRRAVEPSYLRPVFGHERAGMGPLPTVRLSV